jgi:hypothetical protein
MGEKYCRALFGSKIAVADGKDVIKTGLLAATSLERFNTDLQRLKEKFPEFYPWYVNIVYREIAC